MRIAVTVVIDMTDEQVAHFAKVAGLPDPVRAKDVVEHVNAYVLGTVQDSAAFGGVQAEGYEPCGATVSLKGR